MRLDDLLQRRVMMLWPVAIMGKSKAMDVAPRLYALALTEGE